MTSFEPRAIAASMLCNWSGAGLPTTAVDTLRPLYVTLPPTPKLDTVTPREALSLRMRSTQAWPAVEPTPCAVEEPITDHVPGVTRGARLAAADCTWHDLTTP